MHIGEAAKELREALGASIEDAAKELGLTPLELRHIELGETSMTVDLAMRYQKAWMVDPLVYMGAFYLDASKMPESVRAATIAFNMEQRAYYHERGLAPKGTP